MFGPFLQQYLEFSRMNLEFTCDAWAFWAKGLSDLSNPEFARKSVETWIVPASHQQAKVGRLPGNCTVKLYMRHGVLISKHNPINDPAFDKKRLG